MIHGSIVALITPFKDGKLDEVALRNIVKWHIEQGTNGIVPVGTTGECPTLTPEEHCRVIEITAEIAKGKMSIIAGAGSNNPVEAIEYSKVAEKAGADATLHVAGYYNRPNQDVAKLAELPRVIGIKDATGDLARPWVERQLIKRKDFVWLSGEDATAVSYNVAGGTGVISVTANVAPKLVAEVQALTLAGKYLEAREKQDSLMRMHKLMFKEPSPAGAKYACSLLGLCTEECRLPVMPLSAQTKAEIKSAMQDLGLI